MAERLVIDTFNVLHVTGVLPPELAGPDAVRLAGLITRSRWASMDVRLVCDGAAGNLILPAGLAEGSRIRLVFAGHGPDAADIMIERIIAEDSAPRTLLVVSSDRRILTAARRRRSGLLTSEQFLQRLADDAMVSGRGSGAGGGDGGAVNHGTSAMWLREFGFEPGAGAESADGDRDMSASGPDPLDAELGSLGIDAEELDMGKWVDGVDRGGEA
jgi:hypothetical protein